MHDILLIVTHSRHSSLTRCNNRTLRRCALHQTKGLKWLYERLTIPPNCEYIDEYLEEITANLNRLLQCRMPCGDCGSHHLLNKT